jgi:hypothetical protein
LTSQKGGFRDEALHLYKGDDEEPKKSLHKLLFEFSALFQQSQELFKDEKQSK